ncbi:MAG: Gfo/Idh/MocA family oxidoreductase [Phycisphaerae bacterium]
MSKGINRRKFLKQTAAGAGLVILSGSASVRAYAANEKLNFAFVATGGRGEAHLGLGQSNACVALCDVDLTCTEKAKQMFPDAKVYQDYRKMFDEMHSKIDAVVVATPDHQHAPAATRALSLGKHVYCEKPLTWCIHEARVMAEMTRKMKVATQMGNQGHANQGNRRVVEWIRDGAIGDVKEVHTWTDRPVWPQGYSKLPPKKDVPGTLDWNCWIGGATYCERRDHMHPFQWRGWLDYGAGTIGDMGCHTWDCVWWSLQPEAPISAEVVKVAGRNRITHPESVIYRWKFGPNDWRPGFTAYWYSKPWKPPVPEEIMNDPYYTKKELSGSGSIFIGTKGKLYVAGDYGDSPRLIPESFMQSYKQPERMEPSPGHHREFVMAAKGEKPWDYPKSNFTYAGPLVEAVLLPIVALKIGRKVYWDAENCRVKNNPKAKRFVRREYRKGWEIVTA